MSIPLDTKPGTLIVCVSDRLGVHMASGVPGDGNLDGLKRGRVYTVERIIPWCTAASGFSVVLCEIHRGCDRAPGFDVGRFRLAVLPKSITSLLTDVDRKIEETVE